jgi:hypothetical protein
MNDEVEEWCLAPVEAGLCKYESLIDGTLMLEDIARMIEFLTVQAENRARIRRAQEDEARHG